MMTGGHCERLPLVTLVTWATASIGGSKCSLIPSPMDYSMRASSVLSSSSSPKHGLDMDQQLSFLVHRNPDGKKSCRFHGYQHIDLIISTRERERDPIFTYEPSNTADSLILCSIIHTYLSHHACLLSKSDYYEAIDWSNTSIY